MARVVITFEDDTDGSVKTAAEFDPPIDLRELRSDREGKTLTYAQVLGSRAIIAVSDPSVATITDARIEGPEPSSSELERESDPDGRIQ